ncbi:hypothetical protein [Streptomyces sp. NPDC056549]
MRAVDRLVQPGTPARPSLVDARIALKSHPDVGRPAALEAA